MSVPGRRLRSHLAVAFLALALTGCGTMKLPPRLSEAERMEVRAVRFDATVGVTGPFAGHVRRNVVALLQDTGLFTRVAWAEDLDEPPDLVVEIHRLHGGKAIIPLFTILTLGVAPTFFTDDVGYGLVFRTPGGEGGVEVDYHYTARAGLGFTSALLNVLPGWAHPVRSPPRRLARRFAVEIVAKEAEIRALLDRDTGAGDGSS